MFVSPAQVERWDDDTDILHARHQQQAGSIAIVHQTEQFQLGQDGPVGGTLLSYP
jgi:hypothetical protein